MGNSKGGHLLKDILSQSNSFQSNSFYHVGRQDNTVAHALTPRAKRYFPLQIWLESVPLDILFFVLFDIPNLLLITYHVFQPCILEKVVLNIYLLI